MWETWVWSLGWEGPLEKGKATHSSVLAWRIPWNIQSLESQSQTRWVNFTFTFIHVTLRNVRYIVTDIFTVIFSKSHAILSSEYVISQLEILFQFQCDSKLTFYFCRFFYFVFYLNVNVHLVVSNLKSDNQY